MKSGRMQGGVSREPAFWLTTKDANRVRDLIKENKNVFPFIAENATPVSRVNDEVCELVFGELLNLLEGAGVHFAPPEVTPYGIFTLASSPEAKHQRHSLKEFIDSATDQQLSDSSSEYLILYVDRPDLMRDALAYLLKALEIPPRFDSVLLAAR